MRDHLHVVQRLERDDRMFPTLYHPVFAKASIGWLFTSHQHNQHNVRPAGCDWAVAIAQSKDYSDCPIVCYFPPGRSPKSRQQM